MRTLNLIKGLTDKETEQVSAELKTNKRSTLYVLLKELIKYKDSEEEPENAHLYKKIFKQAYTKDKDYLLRNELRLLNEQLYNFYVRATFNNHIETHKTIFDYWLARAFYERRMKGLFTQNIDEFIAGSKDFKPQQYTTHPQYSSAIMAMKSLWMIENNLKTPDEQKVQLAFTEEWLTEIKTKFVYNLGELFARHAYISTTLLRLENKYSSMPEDFRDDKMREITFDDILDNDWYAKYLQLKRAVHQTKREKRVEVIKQMIEIESTDEYRNKLGSNALIVSTNYLALEYISMNNYKQAAEKFAETLELSDKYNVPNNMAHIQNYIVTLIIQGDYNKVMATYAKYEKQIVKGRSFNQISIFKAYAHLFLNDPDTAIEILPKTALPVVQQQNLLRFVFIIAFIQRGQYDIALNELQNTKRFLKKFTDRDYSWQVEITDLFSLYCKALSEPKAQQKDAINTLVETIQAQYDKFYRWAHEEIELWWLMKQLGMLKE